jgi:hypothetical protein
VKCKVHSSPIWLNCVRLPAPCLNSLLLSSSPESLLLCQALEISLAFIDFAQEICLSQSQVAAHQTPPEKPSQIDLSCPMGLELALFQKRGKYQDREQGFLPSAGQMPNGIRRVLVTAAAISDWRERRNVEPNDASVCPEACGPRRDEGSHARHQAIDGCRHRSEEGSQPREMEQCARQCGPGTAPPLALAAAAVSKSMDALGGRRAGFEGD